jgi:hypothetical protein
MSLALKLELLEVSVSKINTYETSCLYKDDSINHKTLTGARMLLALKLELVL